MELYGSQERSFNVRETTFIQVLGTLSNPEVSNLLASLGHIGRRRVVLGHTLNAQTLTKTKKSHNVLSKFMILCWAAFIAILGCMWPSGRALGTPGL